MAAHVPAIFAATFECTLDMIKGNYVDFPEHRLQFFSLLQAITNHCFSTLRGMSSAQQGLLIDSIVWAFRHTERNVADTGLQLLADMLNRFTQVRATVGSETSTRERHKCPSAAPQCTSIRSRHIGPRFDLSTKFRSTVQDAML